MPITTSLAISGINFYQRYISPRKGYRCAYCALHGQESCSQYVKQSIIQVDVWAAIPLIFNRLCACREAYAILQQGQVNAASTDGSADKEPSSPYKKQGDTCANMCTLPCL
jgi:putative component of membrane protein insertase Oxa1/YidC/SpoIIIJ protein YidD